MGSSQFSNIYFSVVVVVVAIVTNTNSIVTSELG